MIEICNGLIISKKSWLNKMLGKSEFYSCTTKSVMVVQL